MSRSRHCEKGGREKTKEQENIRKKKDKGE
jgi:hypothetical protein